MTRVSEVAMTKLGEHAVGLGARIGGLLAARVLTDCYPTVTIVERDVLPNEPVNRRRVCAGAPRPCPAGARFTSPRRTLPGTSQRTRRRPSTAPTSPKRTSAWSAP